MYNVNDSNMYEAARKIANRECSIICINDSENYKISDFDKTKALINQAFNEIMPEKCSFEL